MNLNWFSPLPPAKTGVADFLSGILPDLTKRARVTLWTDQPEWNSSLEKFAKVRSYRLAEMPWDELNRADLNFYNIGNNHLFHGSIWQVARRQPGAVILHDFRLHEFFDSLYRNQWRDNAGYLAQMETNYGEEGLAAAADYVKNGATALHSLAERYPLTPLALENSLGVLVHTREAYEELKQANRWLVTYAPLAFSRALTSTRSSQPHVQPYRLIVFGFISRNRQLDLLLETLAQFPQKDKFLLDIYGEVWDAGHIRKRIQTLGLGKLVTLRGFVSQDDLDVALSSADLAINLRYPTMGEASISQLRIWAHALPTLVTRIGWYGDIPEDVVAHVRPEYETVDIQEHLSNFLADPERFAQMGQQGQQLLAAQHSPQAYVGAVLELATQAKEFRAHAVAYDLAERVGTAMSAWADVLASDEALRKVAEEILALTSAPSEQKLK
jgi:glycosyltransferase involved in cell wall biosynthesis